MNRGVYIVYITTMYICVFYNIHICTSGMYVVYRCIIYYYIWVLWLSIVVFQYKPIFIYENLNKTHISV